MAAVVRAWRDFVDDQRIVRQDKELHRQHTNVIQGFSQSQGHAAGLISQGCADPGRDHAEVENARFVLVLGGGKGRYLARTGAGHNHRDFGFEI